LGTPVWKGQLAYGGRSFAATILTGARAESISFNHLHQPDGSRVKQVLFCAAEDKAISRDELVKGYEYAKGEFIVLDQAEIDALSPDAPKVIDLRKFVPLHQVDPVFFESSYYVAPDADGEPAYAALFGALRRTSLAGIAEVCLYSRERPLLFRAGESGIIAHSLLFFAETRSLDQFRIAPDLATDPELAAAARALKALNGDFDPADHPDRQRERTKRLIEAKVWAKTKPAGKAARRSRTAA
jgi:DNA end-binding protein Ku